MGLFGPEARDVLSSLNVAAIPVGAGATVYSKSFSLKQGLYFSLFYKAASAGAIDLTIQLEQSDEPPTTEGAANVKYVIPASMDDIHTNLADANWNAKALSPVAMPYGRLKITSAAGVANTLQAKLCVQEGL
jgi:hypothetical protein